MVNPVQTGCFAKQSGLLPRLGEYSNVGSESGKRKTTALRHLRHPKQLVAGAQLVPTSAPISQPDNGSHFAGGQGNTKARSCRRVGAGNFHTLLKGMIKSRTEASRMVRSGRRPSVRGALTRAPPSPRCTALSVASCGNHGAAPNPTRTRSTGTRVPGNLGGNDRFAGKVGFSPDLESTRMWAASLEKAK